MFNSPYGHYGGNPFLHSSYLPDRQYYQPRQQPLYYNQQPRRPTAEEQLAQEARARALAERRARRSQWLPDEDDDYDDSEDWEYGQLGPRERMYLEARKRQQQLERQERMRQEQELARQRALEEQKWQQQLDKREREENEKKRKVLEEQRKLQQERRERLEAERAKANARRAASRSPSREHQDGFPNKKPSPSPTPKSREPTPKPQYDEKHEEAASTIQRHYRIYHSLKSIRSLEDKFKDLKNGFTYPPIIEFLQPDAPDVHIHVEAKRQPPTEGQEIVPMEIDGQPEGKLAYSLRNYPLHAYIEALSKLLMQLDGVDSWGSSDVRNKRRGVVKEIEQEVQRVEVYWKNAWQDYVDSQKEEKRVEEGVQTEDEMS